MSTTNGGFWAFPSGLTKEQGGLGLTKREYFAGMAMQGILASPGTSDHATPKEIAEDAVDQADALLAALEEKPYAVEDEK